MTLKPSKCVNLNKFSVLVNISGMGKEFYEVIPKEGKGAVIKKEMGRNMDYRLRRPSRYQRTLGPWKENQNQEERRDSDAAAEVLSEIQIQRAH